jgi:deoxyadenosine/deoxycytidine kinase
MILLINGSFGVGKTTVGRILRKRIAGSVLYNPEWTGSLLMRVPIKFEGSGTDDFQDIDLWRKSVVSGIKIFRFIARDVVIVPMTFYRREYFDEIISGVCRFDSQVRTFCLKASFETILKRLEMRGEKIEDGESNWAARKTKECIEAHKAEGFGETINTNGLDADEVADKILEMLGINS